MIAESESVHTSGFKRVHGKMKLRDVYFRAKHSHLYEDPSENTQECIL